MLENVIKLLHALGFESVDEAVAGKTLHGKHPA